MGQKPQSPLKSKTNYDLNSPSKHISITQKQHNELLTPIQDSTPNHLLSSQSQSILSSQRSTHSPQITLQSVQQQQQLLQFIGQIIYYCKLHMRKQRKYKYKISALLFYKYFFDKFRQLLNKYYILYQKGVILREQYDQKVTLVCQVKDTFITIRKFVFSKIPFLSERTKSYLDEDSQQYCFDDRQFFTQLLYPEVGNILKSYFQSTNGELNQAGVNQCYMRMIKSIFIIQELEFNENNKLGITSSQNQPFQSDEIGQIQRWSDQQIKQSLSRDYERFSAQFIKPA